MKKVLAALAVLMLAVSAHAAPPQRGVAALTCPSYTLKQGTSTVCTVTLKAAETNDVFVSLGTDSPLIHAQTTVIIPAGQTENGFILSISSTSKIQTGRLMATYGYVKFITITVTP